MGLAAFNRMRKLKAEEDKKAKIDEKVVEETAKDTAKESKVVNLTELTKDELEKYAREQYGVELDKRKSKNNMLEDLKEALKKKVNIGE